MNREDYRRYGRMWSGLTLITFPVIGIWLAWGNGFLWCLIAAVLGLVIAFIFNLVVAAVLGLIIGSLKRKHAGSITPGPIGGMSFHTFSSIDTDRVAEEMGEMYFQCPQCSTYERVNNIGKMMLKSDPNYFTSVQCIKCKHTYNARARLQKGQCPDIDQGVLSQSPIAQELMKTMIANIKVEQTSTSQDSLVQELLEIGRQVKDRSFSASGYMYRNDEGGLAKNERAREIGQKINSMGGMQAMQAAHQAISEQLGSAAARELEAIWKGIGGWM